MISHVCIYTDDKWGLYGDNINGVWCMGCDLATKISGSNQQNVGILATQIGECNKMSFLLLGVKGFV